MPEAILTPDQHRSVLVVFDLAHGRRDVLDIQANAATGTSVRRRGVQSPTVIKRRLSRLERAQHRVILVNIEHGLPLIQNVRRVIGDLVLEASTSVAAVPYTWAGSPSNLVANAIAHTPEGGSVELALGADENSAWAPQISRQNVDIGIRLSLPHHLAVT